MQTSLMFVDLKPLGVTPNSQKIAIKLPQSAEGQGANDYSGFSDIITALMEITPEQLQNSLGEMEWVKVQGESTGFAPLLDLSGAQGNGAGMAQLLIGEMAQHNLQQAGSLNLNTNHMANLEDENARFIHSHTLSQAHQDLSQHNLNASKKAIPQSVQNSAQNSAGEGLSQTVADFSTDGLSKTTGDPAVQALTKTTADPVTEGMSQSGLASANGEEFSKLKTVQQGIDYSQKHTERTPLSLSKVLAQTSDAATAATITEDTSMGKDAAVTARNQALSKNIGSNQMETPPSTILSEELQSKTIRANDTGVARVAAFQNEAKVNPAAEQSTDQQFGDRKDSNPELLMKHINKDRPAADGAGQNFNVNQGEVSSDLSSDGPDPLSNGRQDARELFQQVLSRMKDTSVKSTEYLSSPKESASQTSEVETNVIRQIVQRMSLHNQGSQSTMTLKLKPEFLGNVHMQISTDNQQVVVRMATESAAVKEMVEQGLQHLKSEMQHHGLEIDKFEVFVSNNNEESRPGQDLAGFRQALKQRQQNAMKKGTNSSHDEQNEASDKAVEERTVANNASEIDYFA